MASPIVQYVVVRGDLLREMGWTVGAVVAQACHATTAVMHLYHQDEDTQQYLKDMDNMCKVVLEVPDEPALMTVAEKLKQSSLLHKVWIEKPENIPTCVAIKPYRKDELKKIVGKLKVLNIKMTPKTST